MRSPAPYALLAAALLLVGCSAPDDAPTTRRPADFGRTIAVAHPVGAYEHEFDGTEADVYYRVEDVARPEPEVAEFLLAVDVPVLGRNFGFGGLEVGCEVQGETTEAETDERLGEAFDGLHEFPMWCAVPEDTEFLIITVEHHDEIMEFSGEI